jgi:hypothetical protein
VFILELIYSINKYIEMINNIYRKKLSALNDIENLDDEKHLFSFDITCSGGYKYFHVLSNDEIFDLISQGNQYLYENYEDNQSVKLFLDLDCKVNKNNYTKIDDLIDDALNVMIPILNEFGYVNIPIIILDATTPVKLSSHIIFPTVIFKSIRHMKHFMMNIQTNLITDKIIDPSVYRVGCLRLLNCSKMGKNNTLKFYKSYNYEYTNDKQLFEDTLITNVNRDIKFIDYEDVIIPKVIHDHKIIINNKVINLKQSLCQQPTDDEIKHVLDMLPMSFNDEYIKWIIVLNVMKGLNKYELWNNYCKKSTQYDETENLKYWNNTNNIFIDINYLVYIVNTNSQNKIPYFETYKPFSPLSYNIKYDSVIGDAKYVSELFTYEHFQKYDTIIIQSNPGTGKTTNIAEYVYKYNTDNEATIISISALISLINQHIKSFCNVNMKSYENKFDVGDNVAICINSLMKLSKMTDKQLGKTILYIDEISSFLMLTHNSTLEYIVKPVYELLIKFVKKCKKLIVSDALINDQCIDFCELRGTRIKLFVKNLYPKHKNIKAIKIKQKMDLINKLLDKCQKNEYFLFASDSKKIVKMYYDLCISKFKEDDNRKYVLITRDSNYTPKNVNDEWKDKFIFYSPKVVYGVDYTIDQMEDVFIYIQGKTLSPPLLFQQSTRCRNMSNLYYMFGYDIDKTLVTKHKCRYDSLSDCENKFTQYIETNNKINDVCRILDENDNYKFIKNSFFKLFVKNEYMIDCYNSNKFYYFEKILIDHEFILSNFNEQFNVNFDIPVVKLVDEFNDYINAIDKNLIQYDTINKRIKLLNLPDDLKIVEKYKEVISNEHKFNEHLNIIRFLKTDEYIEHKLNNVIEQSFNVTYISNIYNKIKLLRHLMNQFQVEYFNIKYDKPNLKEIKLDDKQWELFKKLFRITKDKPKNHYELIIMIVGMIKHITCPQICDMTRYKHNKERYVMHELNFETIKYHIDLNKFSDIEQMHFHKQILIKKDKDDVFIDE